VTAAELANNSSNEAIQANLAIIQTRDELLRMAPWDCATGAIPLNYITSLPGTPENQSTPINQVSWSRGLPLPPWTYEYQYPVDCLRALYIIPQFNSGVNGTPIYPSGVSTGFSPLTAGPPQKFNVGIDQFYSIFTATVNLGGVNYNVGDIVTLASGNPSSPPIGAPAQLLVTSVGAGGAITGVSIVNSIINATIASGGSYFNPTGSVQLTGLPYPDAFNPDFSSAFGGGSGAAFNVTFTQQLNQRVILTNQEFAVLMYCRQVTDANVFDPLFQKAWINILGATLCMVLTGDKQLANSRIQIANSIIAEARAVDGNEGLTINDVTPDFLRIRGVTFSDAWNAGLGFDWGTCGFWPGY
jgi:hypothetical protein